MLTPWYVYALSEDLVVTGHVVAHARRGPACNRFDVVAEPIVPVGGVQAGHRQQVLDEVSGTSAAFLVAPQPNGTST